ncbi:MAG: hypothetical protein E7258_08320 [Lachnospiraceae bacterium]|nr:hypothetical protein [Lachnospiraceae bacterium]
MGIDFKKNDKMAKAVTVILAGVLIFIVIVPVKSNPKLSVNNSQTVEEEYSNDVATYYEEKLKSILEESYGEGTMQVMVRVSTDSSGSLYQDTTDEVVVDGVLVVADVKNPEALADISYAVCALFDLPAHRVAVMTKY